MGTAIQQEAVSAEGHKKIAKTAEIAKSDNRKARVNGSNLRQIGMNWDHHSQISANLGWIGRGIG